MQSDPSSDAELLIHVLPTLLVQQANKVYIQIVFNEKVKVSAVKVSIYCYISRAAHALLNIRW